MKLSRLGVALGLVAALSLSAAPAAADNYTAKDGNGVLQTFGAKLFSGILHPFHVLEGMFGGTPTPVNMTNSGALDVTCTAGCAGGGNTLGSQGTITAADTGTASTAGQGGASAVTGTPTANSFVTYAVSGASGGTLTISGTFVATSQIEASYDNGAHYTASTALLRGTSLLTSGVTGPGAFSLDLNGVTQLRVRATAYTSGTVTVNFTSSPAAGMTKILNGVKQVDSGGSDATDTTNHAVKVNVVAGGGTLSPWLPDNGSLLLLSPTTTSAASSAFAGSGTTVYVKNTGKQAFHVRVGSSGVTATVADERLLPGMCGPFSRNGGDRVALITDAGTGAAEVTTGAGNPGFGLCNDLSQNNVVDQTAPDSSKFRSAVVTLTSTTETSLVAAGGAGVKNNLLSIKLCNTSATAVRVDIRDATAGTVQDFWYLAAGQCSGMVYTNSPLKQTTANSAWTAQLSGAVTDVRIIAQYAAQ